MQSTKQYEETFPTTWDHWKSLNWKFVSISFVVLINYGNLKAFPIFKGRFPECSCSVSNCRCLSTKIILSIVALGSYLTYVC